MNITKDGGVVKQIIKAGAGEKPKSGCTVAVHYTGKLTDGTVFDASAGYPFSFVLGSGSVITGWEKGIASMLPGEKATLTVSPEYGYGDKAEDEIPPNSTLVFEVELVSVLASAAEGNASRVASDMERLKQIREERDAAAKKKDLEKKDKEEKKAAAVQATEGKKGGNDKGKGGSGGGKGKKK